MQDEEQVGFDLEDKALPQPADAGDLAPLDDRQRRLDRTQEKRAGDPYPLERLPDDALAQRLDVHYDVWQFRHTHSRWIFWFATDSGRLVCDLIDGATHATVTAAAAERAAADLVAAIEEARDVAECFWHEQGGDYRWIFRRHGDSFDVAVMWCSGVITGWQHVFRADCPVSSLLGAVRLRGQPF